VPELPELPRQGTFKRQASGRGSGSSSSAAANNNNINGESRAEAAEHADDETVDNPADTGAAVEVENQALQEQQEQQQQQHEDGVGPADAAAEQPASAKDSTAQPLQRAPSVRFTVTGLDKAPPQTEAEAEAEAEAQAAAEAEAQAQTDELQDQENQQQEAAMAPQPVPFAEAVSSSPLLGRRVLLPDDRKGVVRFIGSSIECICTDRITLFTCSEYEGPTKFAGGEWVGVELEDVGPSGKTDGTLLRH
jgi:hypothetical protein